MLGIVFFPMGVFLVFIGAILALDSPIMKETLDSVEFLRKNKHVAGTLMVIIGFIAMALS
ncbi:MAG: hypothetical protein ABSA11_03850 [Candidatus Bathyarchaeia archaeon]